MTETAPGPAGELRHRIDGLGAADRTALHRRWQRARGTRDRTRRSELLAGLAADVATAEQRLLRRAASVPPIRYPAELPVSARVDELAAAIRDHQVIVVAGETGSGKSTQLPKICLDIGRGVRGLIGHTQPRRIAARALAERIAEETGTELGGLVGYTIRFGDHTGPDTLVKLMTDGILLAEIARDRMLSRYDTIILDEAHERSLNIDFLLGYFVRLLPQRPDLKLIITSATIDPGRFSAHFGDAPVIEVSGRTYPVEVRYRPWRAAETDDDEDGDGVLSAADQSQAITAAVDELGRAGDGDILVFLSGEREIRDTAEVLRGHLRSSRLPVEVVPLYGRLTAAEQHRVFEQHSSRRVVLATNVAETSLTVPGIRYVIDPGTARISRFSARTKVQRLPIEPISQASARQRAGRCGRVADGICIRLYSESDFEARPVFTDPEILRTSLASVLLQMADLDLGDIATFPFLDPPDARQVADGLTLLDELGAISSGTDGRGLTPVGRSMAKLPLDPQLARMIVAADEAGCVPEALVLTAALAIQDVREFPLEQRAEATASHARFADKRSDFLAILNLWRYLRTKGKDLSGNAFRRMCRQEYLHYLRVREWQDLVGQLRQIARSVDIGVGRGADGQISDEPDEVAIHRTVLTGLLAHVGSWDEVRRDYQGTRGARFSIWPGSSLARSSTRLVVAAELVETSKLWARTVAAVEPEQVEAAGAHLVKRNHSEPRWSASRGSAVATEKVTLLGVPIVAARTVALAAIDPELSRELFLRHGLVEGEWPKANQHSQHRFLAHNRELLERIEDREERARRRDIAVDDETLFRLYDERIPASVVSGRHFDSWFKKAPPAERDRLRFAEDDLIAAGATDVDAEAFPDRFSADGVELPLRYVFDPARADDGVTVVVPLAVLQRVAPESFDAQVPGLRSELAVALIRSLPKTLRRSFVPAPDFAAAALDRVDGTGSFVDQVARALTGLTGVVVKTTDFDLDKLPNHLRLSFDVVDAAGRTVAAGKDLALLQDELRSDSRAELAAAAPGVERSGLTELPEQAIPRTIAASVDGIEVRGYPGLVDEGKTVGVRIFATEQEQRWSSRRATARLLIGALRSPAGYLRHALPRDVMLTLTAARDQGGLAGTVADSTAAAVDALLDWAGGIAWDRAALTRIQERMAGQLDRATADVALAAADVLRVAAEVQAALAGLRPGMPPESVADIRDQLRQLAGPGFATRHGAARLPDLVRYLQALRIRLDRLPADPERDRIRTAEVAPLQRRLRAAVGDLPDHRRDDSDVRQAQALLDEWRISLFAQPMRTAQATSAQRVERAMAALS